MHPCNDPIIKDWGNHAKLGPTMAAFITVPHVLRGGTFLPGPRQGQIQGGSRGGLSSPPPPS